LVNPASALRLSKENPCLNLTDARPTFPFGGKK
jgi:hypothetical protein